jgi:hypothetical protein
MLAGLAAQKTATAFLICLRTAIVLSITVQKDVESKLKAL